MNRPLSSTLCAALFALTTSATHAQVVQPAPAAILSTLQLRGGTLQDLNLPKGLPNAFPLRIVLGKQAYTLNVHKHSLRAPGFKLLVDDGKSLRQVATPALNTYQGNVVGLPDSKVALTLSNGQVQAFISLGSHDWWVQPVTDAVRTAPLAQHVVYHLKDAIYPANGCSASVVSPVRPDMPITTPANALGAAEIALDCDNAYYRKNNSNVATTQAAATQIINAMDVIYRRDVEICYTISAIIVRQAAVYTSGPNVGCSGTGLIQEMATRWGNNHTNVKRDLAHMFSGQGVFSGTIGCAGPPVCGLTGFGVSRTLGSLAANTGLVAHEVGHMWTAGHCSGTSCFIMCASLGGCGGNSLKFGAQSQATIKGYKATRTCLGRCGGCGNEASYTHFGSGCAGSGRGSLPNCLRQNWNQSNANSGFGAGDTAIVAKSTSAMSIQSVDLYMWARTAVSIPVTIHSRAATGGPGAKLGTATMRVGTQPGSYTATFSPIINIPANSEFYIAYTSPATPFLASPISTSGTLADSYFTSGARWFKDSQQYRWNFNINCFGSGATPTLVASGDPTLNSLLQVSVTGGRASSLAVILYSLTAANVDLTGAGAAGCRLYVGATFLVEGAVTNGAGTGAFQALPIPNDTNLCGVRFYQQVFVNDPPTNGLKFVGTSRGQPRIGN